MSKFLQFFVISLVLLCAFIGSIFACFTLDSVGTIIVLIILGVILFVGFLYCLMFALSFIVGKKLKANIINKQFIPADNDEHNANAYYKYTYLVNINNKTRKGSFKVYCLDNDIINNLNIGNEIEAKKFLFAISIDINQIKNNIRNYH